MQMYGTTRGIYLTNSACLKFWVGTLPLPKGSVIFQPSIFRMKLAVSFREGKKRWPHAVRTLMQRPVLPRKRNSWEIFFCFLFWMWDAVFLVVMIYMEKNTSLKQILIRYEHNIPQFFVVSDLFSNILIHFKGRSLIRVVLDHRWQTTENPSKLALFEGSTPFHWRSDAILFARTGPNRRSLRLQLGCYSFQCEQWKNPGWLGYIGDHTT